MYIRIPWVGPILGAHGFDLRLRYFDCEIGECPVLEECHPVQHLGM